MQLKHTVQDFVNMKKHGAIRKENAHDSVIQKRGCTLTPIAFAWTLCRETGDLYEAQQYEAAAGEAGFLLLPRSRGQASWIVHLPKGNVSWV